MIDESIISGLFSLGDSAMQRDLLTHLQADFARLGESLKTAPPAALGRVAHEIKGLASTVGAFRLAELAEGLCILAETPGPDMGELMVSPLRQELDLVIAELKHRDLGAVS